MLGRNRLHSFVGMAVFYEAIYHINVNTGLVMTHRAVYEPKFNPDYMQPRHRDGIKFSKDDVLPLDELRRKQRAGEFLTHGEKLRLTQDAEATRKKRQIQMKKKRK
jgi:hypothetical protein